MPQETDAPSYRVWPPVALGVPLLIGVVLTALGGDPVVVPYGPARVAGTMLVVAFAVWNGWALLLMGRHRTALLPGGATRTILDRGPFAMSRNPLYVGLTVLDLGLALMWPSFWAMVLVPAGVAALWWGAVVQEERYLRAKFGGDYEAYCARVRRWL